MTGGADTSVARPLVAVVAMPFVTLPEGFPVDVFDDDTSGPLSDVLVLDWARCFFKLARVVPASDWSRL